jgi:hypothetical protein
MATDQGWNCGFLHDQSLRRDGLALRGCPRSARPEMLHTRANAIDVDA